MILIPTYNSQEFLEKTLNSAINQTKKTDIVVVDNCSTDGTIDIAKKYAVEIVINDKNLGRIGNWNQCIEIAIKKEAEYFKLLFAGDVLKLNAFEEYESIFKQYDIGLITSKYEIIEKDGTKIVNQTISEDKLITSNEALELNLQKRNWYASPSIQAYSTKSVKNIRFDENFPWVADWKFCIDISRVSNVYYSDKILSEFHKNSRRYYESQSNALSSLSEEIYLQTNLMEELTLSPKYEDQIKKYFINKLISKRELVPLIFKKFLG